MKEAKFRYQEENFYYEGGETLEWVALRSDGCPIPGSVQTTLEQSGLV